MQLLSPEILQDASNMSLALLITGMVLGLVLWLFGWWTHRFWVVLIMTVLAGINGLYEAPAFRAQPVVASLLLALAAGMLALSLVRLLAFIVGGLAGLLAIHALDPSWSQPLLAFLASGLLALVLFRLWMMAVTSFTGTLLMSYCGLCMLNQAGTLDVVAWTEQGAVLLNWVCGLLTLLGMVVQYLLDRRYSKKDKKSGKSSGDREQLLLALPLWGWGKPNRKAG